MTTMTHPAIIRRARTDDAGAISALIQEYVPVGTLLPRAPEFIAERTIDFLVATVRGVVIGCVLTLLVGGRAVWVAAGFLCVGVAFFVLDERVHPDPVTADPPHGGAPSAEPL